ncbi:MAG: DUF4331 domain-containing protein [Gammaproteobacteria bacterium]
MYQHSLKPLVAGISLVLVGAISTVDATSHREAPFVTKHPQVDATDFYMFNSYEPGREDYVTLIANYNPLQNPYGGPNYFALDPNALYEIHIDNTGDGVEDLTFQFRFANTLGNNGQGIQLPIGNESVAVQLKNIGGLSNGDNSAVLNFNESYTLTTVQGDRRSGIATTVGTFAKPYDNVGDKTFGGAPGSVDYDSYVASLTNSGQAYNDVTFDLCPAGAQSGRVFAGQRKESFSIDLGEVFDLVNTVPVEGDSAPGAGDGGGFPGGVTQDPANNILNDVNINTIAIEVHKDCLTGGNSNGIVGGWMTSSMRQVRVLDPTPTFDTPEVTGGAWVQTSRLGNILVNELVIGLPDKDRFNASEPKDDAQFLTYVTNPTLPALLDVLFRDAVNATLGTNIANLAPANLPRNDLVAAFLTGIQGVNADGSTAEMLRLNTAIAATPMAQQNTFGVAGGDLAGFPNGRRPGDDAVDIAERVVMGALCHNVPVDLNQNGQAGDEGDNLLLCGSTPEAAEAQAPVGDVPFTDGAPQAASDFDNVFPYLTTPIAGSPNNAGA